MSSNVVCRYYLAILTRSDVAPVYLNNAKQHITLNDLAIFY